MDEPREVSMVEAVAHELWSPCEIFHEASKIRRARDGWIEGPNGGDGLGAAAGAPINQSHRRYRTARVTPLPSDLPPLQIPFEQALRSRRSVREFSGDPLPLDYLGRILGLSYGVTGEAVTDDGSTRVAVRAAPSAGALYPIEIYLLSRRVEGLATGVYHYQPREHLLECLGLRNVLGVEHAVLYPEVVSGSSAIIMLAALSQRSRSKYGERGYRFALLDAGHIAENIYLISTALGVGAVAMGGFVDDELNEILELNGVDEMVVHMMVIGHPTAVLEGQP